MIDPEVLSYIKGTLLVYDGTHCHFGELAKMLLQDTMKSTLSTFNTEDKFVLWTRKDTEGPWISYPHTHLLLNNVRNRLLNTLDVLRYTMKTPPTGWSIDRWQLAILKSMKIQEKLLDFSFMKCVLEEFILLVYSPV